MGEKRFKIDINIYLSFVHFLKAYGYLVPQTFCVRQKLGIHPIPQEFLVDFMNGILSYQFDLIRKGLDLKYQI